MASNIMLIVLESWALFNSHKVVGFKTTSHSTLAKMNDSENWVFPFWVFFCPVEPEHCAKWCKYNVRPDPCPLAGHSLLEGTDELTITKDRDYKTQEQVMTCLRGSGEKGFREGDFPVWMLCDYKPDPCHGFSLLTRTIASTL